MDAAVQPLPVTQRSRLATTLLGGTRIPGRFHRFVNRTMLQLCPSLVGECVSKMSRAQLALTVDESLGAQLDELPSETTREERRFLYQFFSTVWSGGNVLEVGPFLGGTTRCMALGMLANPRRRDDSRLYTFDRFRDYFGGQQLVGLLADFFDSGRVSEAVRDRIRETTSFREVFDVLHGEQSYASILEIEAGELAELRRDFTEYGNQFDLGDIGDLDAVFVDGCKSWFGTKHFMQSVSERTAPGAFYIFQDYAHFTCFWLPLFVGLMDSHFRIWGSVDTSYVFQLVKPFTEAEIEACFPDEPESLDAEVIASIFHAAAREADDSQDVFRRLVTSIQHAGAIAYIGDKETARRLLDEALAWAVVNAPQYEKLVRKAMRAPTYRPNGGGGEPVLLSN